MALRFRFRNSLALVRGLPLPTADRLPGVGKSMRCFPHRISLSDREDKHRFQHLKLSSTELLVEDVDDNEVVKQSLDLLDPGWPASLASKGG